MSTYHIGNEISVYHLYSHLMFCMIWCTYNIISLIKHNQSSPLTSLKTSLPWICIRHHRSYIDHIEIWSLWQINAIEKCAYIGDKTSGIFCTLISSRHSEFKFMITYVAIYDMEVHLTNITVLRTKLMATLQDHL